MSRQEAVEAVLSQIQSLLMAEAERAIGQAERFAHDRKRYRHEWARLYVRRGEVALAAAALLDDDPLGAVTP
jgi:hypothetical protein